MALDTHQFHGISAIIRFYVAPGDSFARFRPETKYAAYAAWGQDKFLPEDEKFNQPFEQLKTDRFIIGDPVFVRDELQRYYEVLGVNHFILRMHWPGLPQDNLLRSIDLLGEKVLPFLG